MLSEKSIALLKKYLSCASNASFNKFAVKEKDQIIMISKDSDCNTPLQLIRYWVNCYNQTTADRRSTAKIKAIPKKEATVTCKKIFDTAVLIGESSQKYKNKAILTLGDYANLARETLKPCSLKGLAMMNPAPVVVRLSTAIVGMTTTTTARASAMAVLTTIT